MIRGKEAQTPRVCLSMTSHALMDGDFRAMKGQTYKLRESTVQGSNELCVSVARP